MLQGVCHLLTNIGTYCNSAESAYELPEEDDYDFGSEYDQYAEAVDQDLEDDNYQNYGHEFEANTCAGGSSELNISASKSTYVLDEGQLWNNYGTFPFSPPIRSTTVPLSRAPQKKEV